MWNKVLIIACTAGAVLIGYKMWGRQHTMCLRCRERQLRAERRRLYRLAKATLQEYFQVQITLGEECIEDNRNEDGVEHFARALFVCAEPERLWEILEMNIPYAPFQMLVATVNKYRRDPPEHIPMARIWRES